VQVNGGASKLLVLDGTNQDDFDSLIVAAGSGASDAPTTGSFTFEGVHVFANRTSLNATSQGNFRLTANLAAGGGSFTYATTDASGPFTLSGTGSVDVASGALLSTGLVFRVAGGSDLAARLDGQIDASGAASVIGVFATTNDAGSKYGGGFIGAGPQVASLIEGFGSEIGIGQTQTSLAGHTLAPSVFVADDIGGVLAEANSASDATRMAAYLASVSPASYPASADVSQGNGVKRRTGGTVSYDSEAINVTSYADRRGFAEILFLDARNHDSADSVILAGGSALSGGTLGGGYTWKGVHGWASRGDIGNVSASNEAAFTLRANFATNSFTFASAAPLAGSGSVNPTTGRLTSTSMTFTSDGNAYTTRLAGLLHGAGAQAVSGVYSTTGTGSTGFAGAFVGSGPQETTQTTRLEDGSGIGEGRFELADTSRGAVIYVAEDIDAIRHEANSASDEERANALLASLGTWIAGNASSQGSVNIAPGSLTYRGTDITATSYASRSANAQLLALDASPDAIPGASLVTLPGSLIIAGGNAVSAIPTSGSYTWEGVQVWGQRDALDSLSRGTFRITTTFGRTGAQANSFTYATTGASPAATLLGTGTLDGSTGRLGATALSFNAGSGAGTLTTQLVGQLHGAGALALSGIFTTTSVSGTQYAGGFVGAGPQVVETLDEFTLDDSGIGRAELAVTSGGAALPLLVLADGFDDLVTSANSIADSVRSAGLMANLDARLSGTASFADNVNTRTGASFTFGGQNISVTSHATHAANARLLVLDGSSGSAAESLIIATGEKFSGTPSGSYNYEGAYFVAPRGSLHDTTRGTFTAQANFQVRGFSLLATTTQAGRQSTLAVTRGAIDATSGALTAREAAFTYGAGAASRTLGANVYAQLFGADGLAIVGVFASLGSSGTQYGGGFVGAGPQTAVALFRFNANANSGGGGTLSNVAIGEKDSQSGLFVTNGSLSDLLGEVNSPVAATSRDALLANLAVTFAGSSVSTKLPSSELFQVTRKTQARLNYKSSAIPVTLYESRRGDAQLLVLDGRNHPDADSMILASGSAATRSVLGEYNWSGTQIWAERGALHNTSEGRFRLSATFVAGSPNARFTYSTLTQAGAANVQAGGSIEVVEGSFTSASGGSFSFTPTQSGASAITQGRLDGRLSGANANGISGLFATTLDTGTNYVGGFVGSGEVVGRTLAGFDDGWGIGSGDFATLSGSPGKTPLLFAGAGFETLTNSANQASVTLRDQALVAERIALGDTSNFDKGTDYLRSGDASLTHDGGELSYSAHLTEQGGGRLLVISGASHASQGPLLLAGGDAVSNIPTSGSYTWQGRQIADARSGSSFTSALSNRFEITVNFDGSGDTRSFSYTTLGSGGHRLSGGGTLDVGDGRLAASGLDFTPSGAAVSRAARLDGLLHGDGAEAISGLFTTTAGAGGDYVGGFVGAGPRIASEIEKFGAEIGIGEASLGVAGGAAAPLVFVADDIDAILNEANSASDSRRASALLASIVPTSYGVSGTVASGNGVTRHTGATLTHDSNTLDVTQFTDARGFARILFLDASGSAPADSVIVATGNELAGITLAGRYTWKGVHTWTARGDIGETSTDNEAAFTLTANFGNGNDSFVFSSATPLAAGGNINKTTGRLTSTSASFTSDGGALAARLDGWVHGQGAQAVSGVYSTIATGTSGIAGAFVGSGPQDATQSVRFNDGSGIGEGRYALAGATQNPIIFFAQDIDVIRHEANDASDSIRDAALLASLGTALSGTTVRQDGVNTNSGVFTYAESQIAGSSHSSWNGIGRLVAIDASAHPQTSSLLVAGGVAPSAIPASGAYTWEGVQLWGERDQIDDLSRGTFRLTTTFGSSGNAFTYATTGTSPAITLAGSGTLDPSSGKLNATALTFTPGTGASGIAARLDGSLLGAGAQAVSGIFATTAATGTKYAGGFVGAGPVIADRIDDFGTDLGIGEASLSVAGAPAAPLVFVADNFDAILKESNSASDSARASALLANVNPTSFTNSANVSSGNGVTRETGATLAHSLDTYGVTRYADRRGFAKIMFLDEDDHASSDSLIIATGARLSGDAPTGGYTLHLNGQFLCQQFQLRIPWPIGRGGKH